jgi:hypothetical protein
LNKFQRNYQLLVYVPSGDVIKITPPLTIEFDIQRDFLSSSNVASITVYNLAEETRGKCRKDAIDYALASFRLEFKAGYGSQLSTIFKGTVNRARSHRKGTEFLTQFECFDGGFAYANAQSGLPFIAGTTNREIIEKLIEDLKPYGVEKGAIGEISGEASRAGACTGSTIENLTQKTNGSFFIDNGKANVLSNNEVIDGTIPLITSASGLLSTPTRENNTMDVDLLFEPQIQIGYTVELQSITNKAFNGFWKVCTLKHRGIISDAVSGNATTSMGLWNFKKILKVKSAS